jgi:general stress protein CsbA
MSWKPILFEKVSFLLNKFLFILAIIVLIISSSYFEDQLAMFRVFFDVFRLLLVYLFQLSLQFCQTGAFRGRRLRSGC